MLEPTYKYIILVDVEKWGPSGMTIEDGHILACDGRVKNKLTARKRISSAVLGGEGFFNLSSSAECALPFESNVPEGELIEVEPENDELKIDGNLGPSWSSNLDFTVERSTKTPSAPPSAAKARQRLPRKRLRPHEPGRPDRFLLMQPTRPKVNPAVKNNLPAGK